MNFAPENSLSGQYGGDIVGNRAELLHRNFGGGGRFEERNQAVDASISDKFDGRRKFSGYPF